MKIRFFFLFVLLVPAIYISSCASMPGLSSQGSSSQGSSASSSTSAPKYPAYQVTNTLSIIIPSTVISTINPLFFGEMFSTLKASYGTESLIKPLNVKFLRAGADWDSDNSVDSEFMDNLAYYSSYIGATPWFSLPFSSLPNVAARVARATNILSYYIDIMHYPLSWVEIGAEPDDYYNIDVADFNVYIDSYTNVAVAIKGRYPWIKIAGPSVYQSYGFIKPFLQYCGQYVDAVSVHYYPSDDLSATYDFVTNQFDYILYIESAVISIIESSGQPRPLIIGECNVCADGSPNKATAEASWELMKGDCGWPIFLERQLPSQECRG